MTRQRGFSIVECMIALFISALCLNASIKVYVHIKHNHQRLQAHIHRQARQRLVAYFLRRAVRQAMSFKKIPSPSSSAIHIIHGPNNDSLQVHYIDYTGRHLTRKAIIKTRYFIAPTKRFSPHKHLIIALYRKQYPAAPEELVAGVNALHIKQKTNGLIEITISLQVDDPASNKSHSKDRGEPILIVVAPREVWHA